MCFGGVHNVSFLGACLCVLVYSILYLRVCTRILCMSVHVFMYDVCESIM